MQNYFFRLLKNRNILNNQIHQNNINYNEYLNTFSIYKTKNYINTLLSSDNTILKKIENNINKDELTMYVTNVVKKYIDENGITNENTINKVIQDAIDKKITELVKQLNILPDNNNNIFLEQAISTIDSYKEQTILDMKYSITSICNELKQDILSRIDKKKEEMNSEIFDSYNDAIIKISIFVDNDNDKFVLNIKNELLQKIEYIFQQFYHDDSKIIMEKYPL